MSLKFGFWAVLLLAAAPVAAQAPAAPPAPPPMDPHQAEIQRTAMAFGQCISAGLQNLSATITPEAGATAVLNGCSTQRAALTQSVNAMIATLPADQQGAAHTQFESQIGQAPTQIADAIRRHRAESAAPAAPATPPH
jgi:uncharacterized protein YukE